MKLHLPRLLAAAVLTAIASAPVYSATIPEEYEVIDLLVPGELWNPNNVTSMGVLLFDGKDYTYYRNDATATEPFYNGPSLFFTSAPEQSSVGMAFSGGYTKAFSEVHHLTFADMRNLVFSAMQSGVIYSSGEDSLFTISGITDEKTGNYDVDFRNNSISGNCGGSIDADFTHISIENNGGVRFYSNRAQAEIVSSGNQNQGDTSSGGTSVAVGQSYTLNLFGYKLSFEFGFGLGFKYESENDNPQTPEVEQMDICGGAVNLTDSSLVMASNEAVIFTQNSALDYGGAISASPGINSTVTISNNEFVRFHENQAHGHVKNNHIAGGGGGAIFLGSQSSLVIDGNTGDIEFTKNLAAAAGGAIYHNGQSLQNTEASLRWTNNTGNIIFEDNIAGGSGGAIYMHEGSRLEMSGNTGIIRFDHNKAGVSGGAISALGSILTLEHNSEIIFSDNIVFHQGVAPSDTDSFSSYYVGGAIYGSNIQIHNNGSVLFQRNAEIADDGSFCLRSIYVEGYEVSLSAGKGQTIEFRDSIYTNSSLHLNSGYADLPQEGDIIFTGATTEEDLRTAKKAWLGENATITVTEKEIEDSRTSTILNYTVLNGGRLRVEKGAIFKTCSLTLNNGSKSTLRIDNAKVVNIAKNGEVSTNAFVKAGQGTTLEILGHSAIEGGQLIFADGAKWSYDLNQTHESWQTNSAALTFDGELKIEGGLTLILNLSNSDMKHWYQLYQGSEKTYEGIRGHWTAENITVYGTGDAAGIDFNDLVWENDSLYYVASMVWSNALKTREWDFDDRNWQNDRTFNQGMKVKFTDAGAGTVNLAEALAPGTVIVSNSKGNDYTFTGQENEDGVVGKLTYKVDLEKRGDGTLNLDLANDYEGTTKLQEGTLNLHDDKALGNSTLTTAEGTTLGVGDGADVVLKDREHVIKGDVEVATGSSLEIASGTYKATSSTIDGSLIFSEHAIEAGSLAGSGALEVTNGATVVFQDASAFTGSVSVDKGGSFTLNLLDGIVRVGEIAVKAGDLTLKGLDTANQLTMAGGTILSMVAGEVTERVTTVVADKLLQLAEDAILSAMLSSMLNMDTNGDNILNEAVGGQIVGPGLILNAGSTLTLDNCFIGMSRDNSGSTTLTLNVTPEDIEKINLELYLNGTVNENSQALLFVGVDTVNFVYDNAIIGSSGKYECLANHYFSGNMVGENTMLVFNENALYLTNMVPEPTTATLSLLALAALAARRRRK